MYVPVAPIGAAAIRLPEDVPGTRHAFRHIWEGIGTGPEAIRRTPGALAAWTALPSVDAEPLEPGASGAASRLVPLPPSGGAVPLRTAPLPGFGGAVPLRCVPLPPTGGAVSERFAPLPWPRGVVTGSFKQPRPGAAPVARTVRIPISPSELLVRSVAVPGTLKTGGRYGRQVLRRQD